MLQHVRRACRRHGQTFWLAVRRCLRSWRSSRLPLESGAVEMSPKRSHRFSWLGTEAIARRGVGGVGCNCRTRRDSFG